MSDGTVGSFHRRMYSTDQFGRPQEPMPGDAAFRISFYGLFFLFASVYGAIFIALIHGVVTSIW